MRNFLLSTLFLVSYSLSAAPGDTVTVSAHQKTNMTWYQSYKEWAQFPDGSKSYHKILLRYDLGCASSGCSDWDYTTLVNILHPTGLLDSNIQSFDTLGTNPLVIDTVWNTFPEKEKYELAKVITPYGGNLQNSWQRRFYFDVTDYYHLLRDSVELEVFYQGWSSGFSATLDFLLIEGTPPRDVLKLENLYRGGFQYRNSQTFESQHMPERTVTIHDSTQYTNLRMAPSGHGFVNNLNCAEFCKKDYIVNVNGSEVARQLMWRDDCGANGLFPQAGTWLYDRANWCPGDRVNIYNHDLTSSLQQSTARIDVDIEPYSYTVPPGESPASYNMSAQLIQYGEFNHQYDLELTDILKPSAEDEYARLNPVCDEAAVRITNKGAQTISNFKVIYGIRGNAQMQEYNFQGSLAPMASVDISLPLDSMADWTTYRQDMQFRARVELPANTTDEVAFNNSMTSTVYLTPEYPGKMELQLRTNSAASETFWELRDAQGKVLYSGDNLQPNTLYRDTFDLQPGCYEFFLGDRDEDGLMFFANNDGRGSAALRNAGGSFFIKQYNANFGSYVSDHFTVGYGINLPELREQSALYEIYPNPVRGELFVENFGKTTIKARILTTSGKVLAHRSLEPGVNSWNTRDLTPGVYFVELRTTEGSAFQKIVVQ